jgi:hypothetical protein
MVLAAHDLPATARALEAVLDVSAPFRDEGVGHFGLENAVYAIGDCFVEIVSPVRADTAAGRYLDRRGGDSGYMVMFEAADAAGVRARLESQRVRIVHDTTHPDIVDLHLHPKDVPAAIVAIDITDPVGSWRWGGPAWTATVPAHQPGGLRALTVAALDPAATALRWGAVLAIEPAGSTLTLDGGRQRIEFSAAAAPADEGIVSVTVAAAGPAQSAVVAGVTFHRIPEETS